VLWNYLAIDTYERLVLTQGWPLERYSQWLAYAIASALCPHAAGPPSCWCRPPLPGLPLAFARAHGVDPSRSVLVGNGPAHKTLANPTFGLAFRIVGLPSDAEITGPAFSPKMSTIFFSVQHPGEDNYSSWPPR